MNLTIGKRLRMIREELNLMQVDVKNRTGISNHNLSNWENDKSEPCIADSITLADCYGVTLDELFGHKPIDIHNIIGSQLTNVEKRVIVKLRNLNNEGQLKALEYIDDLEGNIKYNEREKDVSA